ncbi:MAG: flagellar basal body P-ring protein FlgI [Alphaproteobacteria bacterium]|nr:flagellar basal body P-ring protein FlgI [Alphaproteobacteria bacterium]
MRLFRRLLITGLALALALAPVAAPPAAAFSRIKDLADVEGVRDNMLVGYGLVVGLNGTGDSLRNAPFTLQSVQSMLERLGVNTRGAKLDTKNVAAVMVTASLPAFASQGSRIDVTVSAMGDSKSLQGGTLLVTPLLAADGEIYAVAQGPIAVGGFKAQGDAAAIERGVPTNGRIASGAIVEREVPFQLASLERMRLALRNPDFTTAKRIQDAINRMLGSGAAIATNPATVELVLPSRGAGDIVALLTDIEQLRVDPDQVAKVVIDEKTGIIVMGSEVRVSEVAIAQGNLTIKISETPQVSQPQPFSENGETVVVPRSDVQVDTGGDKKLAIVNESVSLRSLVDGLNALGIGPRDMISILQAIKAAGALQAEIEVM